MAGLEMFREIFYQQEPKFPGENSQDVIFQVLDTRLLVIGRLVTCLQSSVELCREASPAPSCEGGLLRCAPGSEACEGHEFGRAELRSHNLREIHSA